MATEDEVKAPPEPEPPEMIDSTFRNGSLTAVGIIAGFSLGFLTRWAGVPGSWSSDDYVVVTLIVLGIGCQVFSLASMLSIRSLLLKNYNRSVRVFLFGIAAVALAVVIVLFADALGYNTTTILRG